MATTKPFKASKKRERKPKPTFKIGPQLNPSYALELEYYNEIYSAVVDALFPSAVQRRGFVGDRIAVNSLRVLQRKAFAIATRAVRKINKHSATTTWQAIEELGKQNLTVGEVSLSPLLKQQIETNVGLITGLAAESTAKLVELYQKHGPDQSAVYEDLKHHVGVRAKLIARDQNAKIFTSLNTERMLASGIATFIWDHSSAGKTPRPCHQRRDGHEFLLKGGPAELYFVDGSDANSAFGGKRGDEGKPGYAINCRCRMRPKVSLDD